MEEKIERFEILIDTLEDTLDLYEELNLDDADLKNEIKWIKKELADYINEREEETSKQIIKIYNEVMADQNQFRRECI